jgi:Mor family transcriptional regulator
MAMPSDGFKPYRSAEERAKKPPMFKGKPWKDVKKSLDGMPWPFKGQAKQFDKKGPPGLSYFKGEGNGLQPGQWVDCLLWRDDKGLLKGIVYHYPQDLPLEKKGNMNVFISPDSKRQGIASKLVAEAIKRYDVDLRQQRYSEEGAAFINNFVRNLPENTGGVSGKMAAPRSDLKKLLRNKRIIEMRKSGKSVKEIAKETGLSISQVDNIVRGGYKPKPGKSRVKKADNSKINQIIENRRAARKASESITFIPSVSPSGPALTPEPPTYKKILEDYDSGKSVTEIAKEQGSKPGDILKTLVKHRLPDADGRFTIPKKKKKSNTNER